MNWDKKTIVGMFVCLLFGVGYMYYLQNKYPDYFANTQPSAESPSPVVNEVAKTDVNPTSPATEPAPVPEVARLADNDLVFDSPLRTIRFDQDKAGLASIRLKEYQNDRDDPTPAEVLDGLSSIQGTVNPSNLDVRSGYAARRDGDRMIFTRTEGAWEITQTYTIPQDSYGFDLDITFKNTSATDQDLTASALYLQAVNVPQSSGSIFLPASPSDVSIVHALGGSRHDVTLHNACEEGADPALNIRSEKLDYAGLDKHYFLNLVWAKDQTADYLAVRTKKTNPQVCEIATTITQKFGSVAPGNSSVLKLKGFFGPKKTDVLEGFDPALHTGVKFGWFSMLARPLLASLKGIQGYVVNWGIAIMLVTLILKLAFYPLTKAATVSQKRMQVLQPQMTAIRERHKDDPARQQRELMAFMSKNKVNPFKGCLPILPQIPVFIAFYNVLSQAIELRHAPFYGWIHDLSVKDPYYITPIILGVFMFLQQKLTPNPGMDKNQEKIMLMMPVIFTVMMLSLPAGMVLYMIVNTVVSILQQQWLLRRLPTPVVNS